MRDYEPDVSQIVALYQQLEDDIITDMIRRMMKMGLVSETTAYQAEVLQAAGLLREDIIAMIAQRTDASIAQIKALFEDAGVQTVEIDNETHEEAGEAPVDIRQDAGMKQVLEAGYQKTLGTMQNLVSTTAGTTQQAFIAACDRAYMQVSSGAFSYQQAIRIAVQNLADTGAYITYPSGHRDRIDVAVRRAVLTGVGQTAASVAQKRAEDAGCAYMELTAHSGARPEHAKWQGQLVIIRGERTKRTVDGLKVFTLKEIGYGEGDGFKGWNCRHNWHPYYPGLSTPNYTQEQLKKLDEKSIEWDGKKYTEYEISQMQRTAERKVRALKRRTLASQEAIKNAPDEDTKLVLETSYMDSAAKLKVAERQLKDFCNQTGRRNDTFRTQVQGFGRSEAQRAVQAAKKHKNAADSTGNASDATSEKSNGHAVDVTPLVQKDNGGTGKTYKEEKVKAVQKPQKQYTKKQLKEMPLEELREKTEKLAETWYKSGKSGISFGDKNPEEVAKTLAKSGSRSSLVKDYYSLQAKVKGLTSGDNSGIMGVTKNAKGTEIKIVDQTSLTGEPNSITQKASSKGGIERNYYGGNSKQTKQIANNDHGKPKQHPFGKNGEHAHDYIYDDEGNLIGRPARELTDFEREENSDIL